MLATAHGPQPPPGSSSSGAFLVLGAHSGSVNVVRFTSTGDYAMTASDDRTSILWNPIKEDPSKSGQALLIKSYTGGHGYSIFDLVIAHDNSKFATVGGDKAAFLWDVTSGNIIRRLQSHTQRINTVAMNKESTLLFTGSYDSTVCIWDLRAGAREPIQILTQSKDSITSICLTESEIVVGSVDGKLRIYDIREGLLLVDDLNHPITASTLANNQKCALSCCLDQKIHLTELSSGARLKNYSGHLNQQYKIGCGVSFDSSHVVAGSEDGSLYIWNMLSGALVSRETVHKKCITSLSCHPSKDIVLTASVDTSVKCWTDVLKMKSTSSTALEEI